MTRDSGASASRPGSRASRQAQGLDPSGFDPSRWHPEQRAFAKEIADEITRDSGSFGLGGAAIHAGAMIAAGRIWLRENPASAIEAMTAGETGTGSTEGESAVAKPDAQTPSVQP